MQLKMKHYVVYHNPDTFGGPPTPWSEPIVYTNKSVDNLCGDRIWLITGSGRPRQYYLCGTFIVTDIGHNPNLKFSNIVKGIEGPYFDPPIEIGKLPWFDEFRSNMRNFAFGLQPISNDQHIDALLSEASFANSKSRSKSKKGAGYGDSKKNRKVEKAAIDAVTEHYSSNGWIVESVESLNLGYDLRIRRNSETKHVEVKGISGTLVSFIITENELSTAKKDNHYVLCTVTSALDDPKIKFYDYSKLTDQFDIIANTYWVKPKN